MNRLMHQEDVSATCLLIDFRINNDQNSCGEMFNSLLNTFRKTHAGRLKWFENREKKLFVECDFIPIEFHRDRYYICKHDLFGLAPKEWFSTDREFVLQSVKYNSSLLHKASVEFRNDREIALEAVKRRNGTGLEYVSNELKNDREIVLESVK